MILNRSLYSALRLQFVYVFMFTGISTSMYSQTTQHMVIINGHSLSPSELQDFQTIYGVKPQAGRYWYDAASGMYGEEGEGAYGWMYPGHLFGEMYSGCSNGTTGVYINGRELPENEWMLWSQILGGYVQAGRYWFDGYGNIGFEGQAHAVANLYLAAQQQAALAQPSYGGQNNQANNGGDNFWSSRFSAGNSNADNTQGYVSVPGCGPVGYGF